MQKKDKTIMQLLWIHIKKYIIRGLLALIPIGLTYLVAQFIYVLIDKRIAAMVDKYFGFQIPGLGLIIFCVVIYLIGYFASNVIGKRILGLIEMICDKIPIIRTVYQVGKQLSSTLSLPEQQVFKKVVLTDFMRTGMWTVGFVTGTVYDRQTRETRIKVFIPTCPNPTTGFLALIKESELIDSGWTVEEGLKAIISGGIIAPAEMRFSK